MKLQAYKHSRRGFTLIEMLVAVAIFGMFSVLAALMFTNVVRMHKQINLENSVLEDSRYLMEKMVRLVRNNTVDYDEYYNRKVIASFLPDASSYGQNFGYYATMFYNPEFNFGQAITAPDPTTGYYGAYYNDGKPATDLCAINRSNRKLDLQNTATNHCPPNTTLVHTPNSGASNVVDLTVDSNTGQNPYSHNSMPPSAINGYLSASAFCDDTKGVNCSQSDQMHLTKELYLIAADGKTKYILGREKVKDNSGTNDQFALGLLELAGEDNNWNGISDSWVCDDDYDCRSRPENDLNDVSEATVEDFYKDFVPISPLRSNVVDLKFYVSPLEDPKKASGENDPNYANNDPEMQIHPHVTIVMTLEPAEDQLSTFNGEVPRITLQTTVSSRIYSEVKSFGP